MKLQKKKKINIEYKRKINMYITISGFQIMVVLNDIKWFVNEKKELYNCIL